MTVLPCHTDRDTRRCYTVGNHYADCLLPSCRGCVPCERHNTRPVQGFASTSDAAKRHGKGRC